MITKVMISILVILLNYLIFRYPLNDIKLWVRALGIAIISLIIFLLSKINIAFSLSEIDIKTLLLILIFSLAFAVFCLIYSYIGDEIAGRSTILKILSTSKVKIVNLILLILVSFFQLTLIWNPNSISF
jgi:hypothetical protein